MAIIPTINADMNPAMSGPICAPGSGMAARSRSATRPAPNITGTAMKNENRAASGRLRPRQRPAEIVAPEREMPGNRART